MDWQVAYLVNADSRYMEMAKTSIHLLRRHNSTVPVTVFFIDDHRYCLPADFSDFCNHWDVELRVCPNVARGYFQDNKVHLGQCEGGRLLLLDADTFVFSDVLELFTAYQGYDVVACTNDWVWHCGYRADFIPGSPVPLNSGVLLCSSRFLRAWTQRLPQLHEALRTGRSFPALTEWLYKVSATAYNREEFGLTICSAEARFRTAHFSGADCKLLKFSRLDSDLAHFQSCTKIFHSYSGYWRRCVSRL